MKCINVLTEPAPLPDTLQILRDLALDHAADAGPLADELCSLITRGDWSRLVSFQVPYDSIEVHHALEARQALAMFQKLEPLPLGVDKEAVALEKFLAADRACSDFNAVFRSVRAGTASLHPRLNRLLRAMRQKIANVLGPCPDLEELDIRFGPGANVHVKRTEACPQQKFAVGPMCSKDVEASGLLPSCLREVPHWVDHFSSDYSINEDGYLVQHVPVEIVPGNLTFVPKNARTYRSIIVGPNLNTLFQAGFGKWIERRLRAFGVDIKDQSRNKRLACRGSFEGSLATIDLSSASDTISRELVRALLPPDWFRSLSAFRTSEVAYKGTVLGLSHFSSMGNGYTFPLETLIFWAATVASFTADGLTAPMDEVGVYGDDIICPSFWADRVIANLEILGFTVNREKSFTRGPFRESCGGDYLKGIDIRPVYVKNLVDWQQLFVLHNHYVRTNQPDRAAKVKRYIAPPLRIYGPDGYGDGHLLSDVYPRWIKPEWERKGYGGHSFETYQYTPRRRISIFPGDYVTPLYTIYVSGEEKNDSTAVEFSSDGRPYWPTPGRGAVRRVKIYTLAA